MPLCGWHGPVTRAPFRAVNAKRETHRGNFTKAVEYRLGSSLTARQHVLPSSAACIRPVQRRLLSRCRTAFSSFIIPGGFGGSAQSRKTFACVVLLFVVLSPCRAEGYLSSSSFFGNFSEEERREYYFSPSSNIGAAVAHDEYAKNEAASFLSACEDDTHYHGSRENSTSVDGGEDIQTVAGGCGSTKRQYTQSATTQAVTNESSLNCLGGTIEPSDSPVGRRQCRGEVPSPPPDRAAPPGARKRVTPTVIHPRAGLLENSEPLVVTLSPLNDIFAQYEYRRIRHVSSRPENGRINFSLEADSRKTCAVVDSRCGYIRVWVVSSCERKLQRGNEGDAIAGSWQELDSTTYRFDPFLPWPTDCIIQVKYGELGGSRSRFSDSTFEGYSLFAERLCVSVNNHQNVDANVVGPSQHEGKREGNYTSPYNPQEITVLQAFFTASLRFIIAAVTSVRASAASNGFWKPLRDGPCADLLERAYEVPHDGKLRLLFSVSIDINLLSDPQRSFLAVRECHEQCSRAKNESPPPVLYKVADCPRGQHTEGEVHNGDQQNYSMAPRKRRRLSAVGTIDEVVNLLARRERPNRHADERNHAGVRHGNNSFADKGSGPFIKEQAERLTRCVDLTFPNPLRTDVLYRIVLLENKRYRVSQSGPYGFGWTNQSGFRTNGSVQRPSALRATYRNTHPSAWWPAERINVLITGTRAFRFTSCSPRAFGEGLGLCPSGVNFPSQACMFACTREPRVSSSGDELKSNRVASSVSQAQPPDGQTSCDLSRCKCSRFAETDTVAPTHFVKTQYQRLRLEALHGLPIGFSTEQFARCLILTEFRKQTVHLPVQVRRMGTHLLELFSPELLPRKRYHLRVRTRQCSGDESLPEDGLGMPLSESDIYFEMTGGLKDSLVTLTGTVWFPITPDVERRMETEGRLTVYSAFKSIPHDPPFKFKEDTILPVSSQEAPEGPSSPSTDSWDVFITPLDDCFRQGNKTEGGRSHDSMRRTEKCDSFEDIQEATSRKEMLLQALQAVEVNFYRKSSLLLRPASQVLRVSADIMASPALSSPWRPTFSRLISLPLATSPPHNTAPVTLLQWRRDASSSSGMYDQSWRIPGPMPPAALVGFTSFGVGVTIVASYEARHYPQWSSGENGIFSSDASWLSDPEDTIISRTAEILVDVVDLGTTRPVVNARIEVMRGSLSFTPTENKDTTKRAHDGVSRSSSSGAHRSAEEDGASNSACWYTDEKGLVRIPVPPSVHPFDPLYVVVTADRHTWPTYIVSERGRSLKSTPTSDLFSPLQDEAALDGQSQTGNVKRGEDIRGIGLHKFSSNGGSSTPSGISTYTSSDKEKNFRGNDPVERHDNEERRGSPTKSPNVRRGMNGQAYVGGPYFIPGNPGQQRLEIEDAARRRAGLFFHRRKVQETIDGTVSPKRFDDVSAKLARFSYERQQMEAVLFSDKLVYAPGETLTMIGFISVTGADACRMSRGVKRTEEKRNENEEKGSIKTEPLCLPHWSLGLDFTTGRNAEGNSVHEEKKIGNNRSDKERAESLSHISINERFFSNDLYVLLTFRWSEEESRYPLRKITTVFPQNQPSPRPSASPDTTTSGRATGGKETESQTMSEMPPSGVAALSARPVGFESTHYLVTRNSRQQTTGVVPPLIAEKELGANLLPLSAASDHESTPGNELEEEAVVSYKRPDEDGIRHTGNTEAFSNADHVCSEFLVPLTEHGSFSVQLRIPRSATQRILKTPAVRVVSPSVALELTKDEGIHTRKNIRIHDSSPNRFSSMSRGRKEAANSVRQLPAAEESGEPQGDDSVTVTEEKLSPPLLCAFDNSSSSFHAGRKKRADIIPVKVRSFSRPVLAFPRLPSVQFVPPVLSVSPVVAPQGELEARGAIQRIGVELRTGKEATRNNYSSSSLFLPSTTVTLSLRIQRRDVRQGDALPSFPEEPHSPLHRSPDFPRSPAPNEIPSRHFSSTPDSQAKRSPRDTSDFVRSSPREASSIQPLEQTFYLDPLMQVGGREQETTNQQAQSLGTGATYRRTGHAPASRKNADSTEFPEIHSPVCSAGCQCLQNAAEDTEWSLVTLQPEASISYVPRKKLFHLQLLDLAVDMETGKFSGSFDLSLLRFACIEPHNVFENNGPLRHCVCVDHRVDFRNGSRLEWQAETDGGIPGGYITRVSATSVVGRLPYMLSPVSFSPKRFLPGVPFTATVKVVPLSTQKQKQTEQNQGEHMEVSMFLFRFENHKERLEATPEEVNHQYWNRSTEFVWSQGLRTCPEGFVKMRGERGNVDITGMGNASNVILIQSCRAIPLRSEAAEGSKITATKNWEKSCVMSTPVDSYPYLLVSELCVGEAPLVENTGKIHTAEGDGEQQDSCDHSSGNSRNEKEKGSDGAVSGEERRVQCEKENSRNVIRQEEQGKVVVPPRTGVREWGCYVDCVVLQATEKTLDTRKVTVTVHTDKTHYDVGEEVILSFRNPFGPYSSIAPRNREAFYAQTLGEATSASEPRPSGDSEFPLEETSEPEGRNLENSTNLSKRAVCLANSVGRGKQLEIPSVRTEQQSETSDRPFFNVSTAFVTDIGNSDRHSSAEEASSLYEAVEKDPSPMLSVSHSPNTRVHDAPTDGSLLLSATSQQVGIPDNSSPLSNTTTIEGWNGSARLNISWLTKSATTFSHRVSLADNRKTIFRLREDTDATRTPKKNTEACSESGKPKASVGVGSFVDIGLTGRKRTEAKTAAKAAQAAGLIAVSAGTVPFECRYTATCKLRLVLLPPLSQERLPLAGLELNTNDRSANFTEAQKKDSPPAENRSKDRYQETIYPNAEAPTVTVIDEGNSSKERRENWLLPEFGPFFIDQEIYINVKIPRSSSLQLPPGVLTVTMARGGDDSVTERQSKEAKQGEKEHRVMPRPAVDGLNKTMNRNNGLAPQKYQGKHTTVVISASVDFNILLKAERKSASIDRTESPAGSHDATLPAVRPEDVVPRTIEYANTQYNTTMSTPVTLPQDSDDKAAHTHVLGLPNKVYARPDEVRASKAPLRPTVNNKTPCSLSRVGREYAATIYLILTDQRLTHLRGPGDRVATGTLFSPSKIFSRAQKTSVRSSLDVRTHTSSSSYHNVHDLASYSGLLLTSEALHSRLQFDPWIGYTVWPLRPSEYFASDVSCSLLTCMRDKYSSSLTSGGMSGNRVSKRDQFPSPQSWNFERSTSWLNSARNGRETAPEEHSKPRDRQADISVTKATAQETASSEADDLQDNVTVGEVDEAELAKLLPYESRHPSVVRLYKVTMHELAPTGSMEGSSGDRVDGGEEEMSMVKKASLKLSLPGSETAAYVVSAFAVVVKKDGTPVGATTFPVVNSERGVRNCSRDETSDRIQERSNSAVLHSQEVWYDYQQAFLEENVLTAPDSIIHLSNGFPPFLRHGDVAYVHFGSGTMFCSGCPASVAKCARNCAPVDNKLEATLSSTSNTTFWCWNSFPDSVLEVTHYFETDDSENSPHPSGERDQRKGLRSSISPTKQQKNEEKAELYTSTERSFTGMSCSQRLRIRVNNVARGEQSGSVQESVIAFLKFREAGFCTKLSNESEWEGAVDSVEAALKNRSLDTKGPLSAYCTGNVTASVRIPVLPSEYPTSIRKVHLLFPFTENASTSFLEASINSSLTNLVTDTAEKSEHVDISSLRYSSQLLVSEEAQDKSPNPDTLRASFPSVNYVLRSGDERASEEASGVQKKHQQPFQVEPEVAHLEGRGNAMAGHDETLAGHEVKDAMNEGTPSSVTSFTALNLPFSPLSQQQMEQNEAVDSTNAEPAGVHGSRTGNHEHTAGEPATTTLEDYFYVPGALDLHEGGFSIEARMGFVAAIERRVWQLIDMHKSTLLYCENSLLRLSSTTSQQADVGGLNESECLMRSAETLSCNAPESNVTACNGAYESVDDQGKTRGPSLSSSDSHQTFRGECPLRAAEALQEKLEDLPNSSVLLSIILAEKIISSFDGTCNSVGVVESSTLSSDTPAAPVSFAGSFEAQTNRDFSTAQAAASSSQNSGERTTCTASIMNMRAAIRTASQAAVQLLPLYVPTETASELSDEVATSSNRAFRQLGLLERPVKQYLTVKPGASNPEGSHGLKDFAPKEPDLSLLLHAARVFRILKRKDLEQPALGTQSSERETILRVEKAVHQAINNYVHARTVEWAKRKTQSLLDVQSGNRSLSLVDWIGVDLLAEVRFSLNATHSFGLPEENESLLGFENIFLNTVKNRTLLSVSEMEEGDQSNGTLLELPALLLASAPASALPKGEDTEAGDHDAASWAGRSLTGQRHMTLEFKEHAVPSIRFTSEPIIPSSTWQGTTMYSPLSMDSLRARIIEESLRRLVFSQDGMYATVATTERVGPFPRSVLPLRSHALLLRLWCGDDSFWRLPRSRALWYMANSVADSDNAGPLLARQPYQRQLGRNSISGDENPFSAVSEEKDLSIVLEALDLLHERLSPRGIRSEPVNIQVTIRAMPSPSSPPLHEKMHKSSSRDENQVDAKFARPPFLSGHRECPSLTADKKVPPFFTAMNVTFCGTNGHGLRARTRRDISWRELMDWREGISFRVGNMSASQATEKSINTTNTSTMYRVRSVVSGPAAGLAVFLSAVYRPLHHMQEEHESHPAGTFVSISSASDSNSYQKINRFWRVFDRHDLRCAGALRSFNEELEGADVSDFFQKGYKRIQAQQYICISIALELDVRAQNLIVEAPLPAGLELVDPAFFPPALLSPQTLRWHSLASEPLHTTYFSFSSWYRRCSMIPPGSTRSFLLTGSTSYFSQSVASSVDYICQNLSPATHVLEFVVQAVTPGNFTAPATVAYTNTGSPQYEDTTKDGWLRRSDDRPTTEYATIVAQSLPARIIIHSSTGEAK